MKRGGRAAGFTIVETMIVLAVTGALFTAIIVTLSGRQRSNEFTQAIQDARSQIQQTIIDVQAGYYANLGDFRCTAGIGGPSFDNFDNPQGANDSCIYLGDVIQFGIKNTDPEQLVIYPVAGDKTATDLASAQATPIAGDSVDEAQVSTLKYGLSVVAMAYGSSNTPTGAVGILSSISDPSTTASGTQQVDAYAMPKTMLGVARADVAAELRDSFATGPIENPAGGIKICLKSGGTDQYGLLTVAQNHRQLSVDLTILDGGSPTCGL